MDKKKLVKLLLVGRIHECEGCGRMATEYDTNPVVYGPDPFAEEIYNDHTSVWKCDNCRTESAWDI